MFLVTIFCQIYRKLKSISKLFHKKRLSFIRIIKTINIFKKYFLHCGSHVPGMLQGKLTLNRHWSDSKGTCGQLRIASFLTETCVVLHNCQVIPLDFHQVEQPGGLMDPESSWRCEPGRKCINPIRPACPIRSSRSRSNLIASRLPLCDHGPDHFLR